METGHGFIFEAIVFLLAAIVAVPVFRRVGLGSILGYLAAGTVIGPHGLALIGDAEGVMHTAELGVVLLLFVIGLELKLSRLWSMRRDIFGLGAMQVLTTGVVLAAIGIAAGFDSNVSIMAGFALALSSTAFGLQILKERGDLNAPYGNRAFAILLFQDISIVPLLALVPLLASGGEGADFTVQEFAITLAAIAGIVLVGRFALNPVFRVLAKSGAQEIMTAAALFVVMGAAGAMAYVGMSMALGAFLAGVLLAESSYRHQLEADIEPFRGLLLGLFFIAVGMTVDWSLVLRNWPVILLMVPALMIIKWIGLYASARVFGATVPDAVRIGSVLPQGGEFAFVLFAASVSAGLLPLQSANLLIAVVTLSMALTPAVIAAHDAIVRRLEPPREDEIEETFEDNDRQVLLIGFGRFGQIVAGVLHTYGCGVTAIDNEPGRIRNAASFGYKVYFGDATRLSVLRAAGAEEAQMIVLCINNRSAIKRSVELIRSEFPQAAIFARATDRTHAIELMNMDVDFQVRETLESAIILGREALMTLGATPEEAEACESDFRHRDRERLILQQSQGLHAGLEIQHHARDFDQAQTDAPSEPAAKQREPSVANE